MCCLLWLEECDCSVNLYSMANLANALTIFNELIVYIVDLKDGCKKKEELCYVLNWRTLALWL